MKVYTDKVLKLSGSVIAIGAFDGVHRGHQAVVSQMVKNSKILGVPSVVYTFDPPPRYYFQGVRMLTTLTEKLERLSILGPDYVVIARFDQHYTTRRAVDFIDELGQLHPLELSVGEDFRFGHNREGDVTLLEQYFKVRLTQQVICSEGKPISSTRIRQLISAGDIQQSVALLGWTAERWDSG